MGVTTVDNTAYDAELAAVPVPFGPLTRTGTTTDLDVNPSVSPNSDVPFRVLSASLQEVFISFDQLQNTVQRNHMVKEAHGIQGRMDDLSNWAAEFDAIINGANFDPLLAPDNYWQTLLQAFRFMPMLGIQMPFEAYEEVGDSNTLLVASFSQAQVTNTVTITNLTTGLYSGGLFDWGDGRVDIVPGINEVFPGPHTYADGSYTTRLFLIGPQGISVDTDSVTAP